MTEIPSQNNQSLYKVLNRVSEKLKTLGHRQLILVPGDIEWSWKLIHKYIQADAETVVITSINSPLQSLIGNQNNNINTIRPEKPNTMLGFSCAHALVDCSQGFYPDALTSISGTIKPGGFLFLLCPPLTDWPLWPDEFAKNRTPYGQDKNFSSPNTINRFLTHCEKHGSLTLEQNTANNTLKWASLAELNLYLDKLSILTPMNNWDLPKAATTEQRQVLADITNRIANPILGIKENQKQFHVIQADRGRGKSHLVGLIAEALTEATIDNGIKYYITAPNKASIKSVFHAVESKDTNSAFTHPLNIEFVAPERVTTTVNSKDILFVDEAASLPLPLLISWSLKFDLIIFATTTHGYEGTGKGFQIRFINHLKSLTTDIHQHSLNTPIRYSENDPLEKLMFSSFCLDSEPKGLNLNKSEAPSASFVKNELSSKWISCTQINQQELCENPALLEEIFSLLVQAHYQTRPSDLRDILDSPNFLIFGLFITINKQRYLATACLISIEGGLPQEEHVLINSISNGTRRPKGHLIPQVLTLHMGQRNALKLTGARIVRIATLPNLQSSHYGTTLLNYISDILTQKHIDYLGSSYADTKDVNSFWQSNQYHTVRTGNRLDKSSGTRSKLVLKPLSKMGTQLTSASQAFYENQNNTYRNYSELNTIDKCLIDTFTNKTGSYEAVKDILERCKNWGEHFDKQFPKKANSEFRKIISNWKELN